MQVHGSLWNGTESGEGEIDEVEFETPPGGIPTNLPGCAASSPTVVSSWNLKLTPFKGVIDIANVTIMFHYGPGCAMFGIPSTLGVHTTITAPLTTSIRRVVFSNVSDLRLESTETEVSASGGFDLEGAGESFFTANP